MFFSQKKQLYIACFPKSGSTYLTKLLSHLTGYSISMVLENPYNEQDIQPHILRKLIKRNLVIHQHTKGTLFNVQLMQDNNIRPTILIRNIADTVFSLRDHILKETRYVATGYVHNEFFEMSPQQQIDYLINIHMPWYFSFLVSWAEASTTIDCHWLDYENLFANTVTECKKIIDFYHLDFTEQAITQAIETLPRSETRYNVGTSGRGKQLSPQQHDTLNHLAKVWAIPTEIMSQVGIDQ